MLNKFTLLIVLLTAAFFIQAQTIISPNIDFDSKEQSHVLRTHKGDQFIGQTVTIRNDTIDFRIRSLNSVLHFPLAEVSFLGLSEENLSTFNNELELHPEKREDVPMPSNQLLYSATALPYRGKGVLRSTMILANQIEIQPSKHFSFNVGTVFPSLISLRLQGKVSLNEFIHTGIVLQEHIILFDEQTVTHAYGLFTIGKYEKYLNLGFGYWVNHDPLTFSGDRRIKDAPTFSLGGSFSFDNGWRVYTETMVLISKFNQRVLPSLSFSRYKGRSMLEIGVVATSDSFIPLIPLFSWNYAFRKRD